MFRVNWRIVLCKLLALFILNWVEQQKGNSESMNTERLYGQQHCACTSQSLWIIWMGHYPQGLVDLHKVHSTMPDFCARGPCPDMLNFGHHNQPSNTSKS